MEAKIVVGTKSGKSYNLEAKEDTAAVFIGKKIGDTVNVTPLGLKGYEVKITGGSDKSGFPMRGDMHKMGRGKALMSTRTIGYRPEQGGVRLRKTVVGDIIDENISQINTIVVKEGKDSIEKLIGLTKESEAKEAEAPKEAAPHSKEAKKTSKEEKRGEPPKEAKEEKEKPKGSKEEPREDKPEEKEAPKEGEEKVEAPKAAPKKESK